MTSDNLQARYPCVLEHFDSFAAHARDKRIAVFLDYDGARHNCCTNCCACHTSAAEARMQA